MAKRERLLQVYRDHLNPNNADFLVRSGLDSTVERAEGARIRDDRGRDFIDFIAGYGVFNLGHNPPAVLTALRRELEGRPLWNRPFLCEPLADLAERLVAVAPGELERVFFCSTGAEAVESAIKLARLATRRTGIVAAQGGYHGYTLGALSVSGIPAQSRPFRPLLPGVEHVPYGEAEALAKAVTSETGAVLLEPFQAEVGAIAPPPGYLAAAREICDRAGALLVIDEVRTGMGRTGPLFAVEEEGVVPDLLLLGKSLAGGIVPIGAMVARPRLWRRFGLSFAMTSSSFAGNRLACTAALAALDMVAAENVLQAGRRGAEQLWRGLEAIAASHPDLVVALTGRGMLAGVHLPDNRVAGEVAARALAGGLLVGAAFCDRRCLLLEPPLIIKPDEIDRGLAVLDRALGEVARART